MILVADTGPLNYLVLIESVEVLGILYNSVVVPESVARELQHAGAPEPVKAWVNQLPAWCEVRPDPPANLSFPLLGSGERSAIDLAISLNASLLLMDDWAGRMEAVQKHLPVIGTLGVLAEAHRRQLVDFEDAVGRLRRTSFYLSEKLLATLRRQLALRRADL